MNVITYGSFVFFPVAVQHKQLTKDREGKKKLFKIKTRYLYCRDNRSGTTWKYTGVRRNEILTFSDSRYNTSEQGGKSKRLSRTELLTELSRLITAPQAATVLALIDMNVREREEVKEDLLCWDQSISSAITTHKIRKAYEKIMSKYP